jgi:hypothetical protein
MEIVRMRVPVPRPTRRRPRPPVQPVRPQTGLPQANQNGAQR